MKKISRRSFLMATGVIAASAALSACGGSSASTSSAGSTAASTAASGSAAQGGGDLVIYSPNSEGLLNATIPLFEEKYGVNVELIQAGTGELVKRIQSEKNDPYADVLFGGSWSQMYTNEDLWEPYVSANDANVIDAYKNKCGFITGNVLDGSVLIVNTDLIGDRLRRSAEPGSEGQDRHCRPRQLLFRFRTPDQYAACNGRLRGR